MRARTTLLLTLLTATAAGCALAEAQQSPPSHRARDRMDASASGGDAESITRDGGVTTSRRDGGPVLDVLPAPYDGGFEDVLGPPLIDAEANADGPVTPAPVVPRDGATDVSSAPPDAGEYDASHPPLRLLPRTGGGPQPPLLGGPEGEPEPPVQTDDAGAGPSRR